MTMSSDRHPTRDALLRDALGQLKEQRGVTLDAFAFTLNSLAHSMCPEKMDGAPMLASLTTLDANGMRAISSWRKRVERWAQGDTELPAWLEEPWTISLEEHGDTSVRRSLVHRHGMIGVEIPKAENVNSCGFQSMGNIAEGMGEVLTVFAQMMEDGVLDENDARLAAEFMPMVRKAVSSLIAGGMLVKSQALGKETIQ